ncbi:hypothetical protein TIFTF001_021132 [Ficus carica]|uniref:Uncharacterized protein n=1 Tax=Ficus carica TaxID=3494 RepID=A0AA88DAF8_FICCA|nr:hypothetical protein TIFTF001_021132 [Ficus carica]
MTFFCNNTILEPTSSSSLQQPRAPFFLATARNHRGSPSCYPPFPVVALMLIISVNLNLFISSSSKSPFLPHHLCHSQSFFLFTDKPVLYPKMLCQLLL